MFGIEPQQEKSVNTAVGPGTRFEGTISTEESIRIDGSFEGTINCNGTLIIGANAEIDAEIVAETAIIGGKINGNITAHKRIEVRNEGEIYGDLMAPALHVEQGVTLDGSCNINTGDESDEAKVTSIKEKLG